AEQERDQPFLNLPDFQPKSMLSLPETRVARAKFPVIDAHTHVAGVFSNPGEPDAQLHGAPAEQIKTIVGWMDELNMAKMVTCSSDAGERLERIVSEMDEPYRGRFETCMVASFEDMSAGDYPQRQAEEVRRAKEKGAVAIKFFK